MLNLADKIVFAKTGQHLDDLQDAVLRGTLQRETYKEIAKDFDCSESRIREIGSELWQILSEALGEDVSKKNVCSAMERWQNSNSNVVNFVQEVVVSSNFNICGETRHPPDTPNSHSPNQETSNPKPTKTLHQDLSEMPELGTFFSRTPQLDTLTTWILQQNCRLITLTGIGGIGKTSLAIQLVHQIKDEFECVIWCNIDASHTPDEFEHKLIQFFSEKLDSPATNLKPLPLIKYLQNHRSLIILDDVHNLLCSGELAGKYKPGYEEYRSLFKQIEKLSHQSCFLLVGWEAPQEVPQLTSQNTPIRTLQLTGLDTAAAWEILRDKGLTEIDNCEALIHRYQGNPLWLKSVATLIQELGIGVAEVLRDDIILLPEDLKDVLREQCDRKTELEKQVLSLLAKENQPVNFAKLLQNGQISSSDLLNALQSLLRRCWIEKQGSLYTLSPVLRQYIQREDKYC
ncbi:MAG TPA: ATPase [Cyanobacteria bacterium UBA11149]|nr:ATPase [Cyanobacteria bacterium UBA11367]HBE60759.1 ATPase [Cyanobacteria bacterium UBA11366]HBK66820.1 ATPase [Cyanobacteria bacterium UBA11166]HBR72810.1 ATPase [Cyanobacteria bacterium UBA11159]HBS68214.1 ATPase [Cyanobacteria bacterium UBA11153]HBW89009.1 ATPase [Cyanobacteria bacterium UBA11149]